MRWQYKTYATKREERLVWHTWFAWYPAFHEGRAFWLVFIERKYTLIIRSIAGEIGYWEYRELKHVEKR